ncbi:unnamed protein product [Cyclocybe aegerita]|uniref:Zn(2)-C6 fungal-type domain-containing protein n=1 Tax=Cyclocybe aegerita TaxID=1973307 RepID=A0A8S0X4X5_CYCAE|nr:unnamed protein product [Cyclocybe aegerita]
MDVILNESIGSLRRELDLLPQEHADRPKAMRKLAHSLLKRYWRFSLRNDLDESIWYHQHALKLKFDYQYQRLDVLLHLCSALFQRIQLLGQPQDVTTLFACLQQQLAIDFDHALRPVKQRLENLLSLPEPHTTDRDIFCNPCMQSHRRCASPGDGKTTCDQCRTLGLECSYGLLVSSLQPQGQPEAQSGLDKLKVQARQYLVGRREHQSDSESIQSQTPHSQHFKSLPLHDPTDVPAHDLSRINLGEDWKTEHHASDPAISVQFGEARF